MFLVRGIWGPRPALLAAAMLRGSQVCSALQPPLAALVWPSATPPQRWAVWPSAMAALPLSAA
ncbi:hypothetical protein SGRA_4222 [Saprospira grandis str. Lewin]|uniref:Uncharacterized protein n=1 Tax=Saprospira grandis (strain Lewin) TaxID=984262 RepID=H6L7I6_SAPGL|nr:hypothetical protein SGRA_4222 [Saprospira grandis str. Lewin]